MQSYFKGFIKRFAVQLLVIWFAVFAPFGFSGSPLSFHQDLFFQSAHAGPSHQDLPSGWESYLDRLDILDMPAKTQNLGAYWATLKAAHFSFVAELLALYPADTHIYFLARDSEHLYDVARLVTEGTVESGRVHLLNVSRANMGDPNLKGYLKDHGITEKTLAAGKKVLFVDTGFSGTIPRVIGEGFTPESRVKLKTHLVVSSNVAHPSSRAFLIHLNPSVNEQNPSGMHGSIVSYEHMARYTDRSSKYIFSQGRYHPISVIGKSTDGSVSKEQSRRFMEDLKSEWQKPETKARFKAERTQVAEIKRLLTEGSDHAKSELKAELEKTKNTPAGRHFEAQIRDALEAQANAGFNTNIKPEELALKGTSGQSQATQSSKKNELIKKYPEWAPVLENPDDKIPELFTKKNWQMIGNLIDANVDFEINQLLVESLFDKLATGIKKDLQLHVIEKGDPDTLQYLAEYTFSQPHTKEMTDLAKLLIEKGDPETLKNLVQFTFAKPHTKDMPDLIKLLIEKGDPEILQYLAHFTFSQPHTKDMTDLIKLLIEKGNPKTLQNLADHTFTEPHTKDMTDLIKLLIEKGDSETLKNLAQFTFAKPHTKDMKELIRLLIDKGDPLTLKYLAHYALLQPHTNTPEHKILRKSLKIADPQKRKDFLDTELMNINSALVQEKTSIKAKPISSSLQPGDFIKIKDRPMKVLKKAGEGRRGIVFQVQAESGALYALKTMKSSDTETLASLAKESAKATQWQALKIPHSKVLIQEKEFVLKTWIEGMSGEELVDKYAAGDLEYKAAVKSLQNLVAKIRAQGAYVGDFRPANLIWTGKTWTIIDSGSIQQGMTLEEAQAKWSSADERGPKFERRWKMPLPSLKPIICSKLFQKAA